MEERDTPVVEGTVIASGRYQIGCLLEGDRRRRVHEGWDTRLVRAVTILLVTPATPVEPTLEHPTVPVAVHWHRPGLVELYDGGVDADRLFLVTQSVPGPSLRESRRRTVDPGSLAELGARLAATLQPVHRAGAAHGALSPDLVLLGGTQPMIAECGLAPVIERWAGTLPESRYRAPEQADGVTSPASDVYALGRILADICPAPGTSVL